jgi:outer membrane protein
MKVLRYRCGFICCALSERGLNRRVRMKVCSKKYLVALLSASLFTITAPVFALEKGDVVLRLGAASVQPDDSSSLVSTTATGPLAGTAVHVGDEVQLGVNLLYMMSDNIGLELLAATPFEHDLSISGLGTYGFSTTNLGSTKHLPPTVSAVYYFGSTRAVLRPYLGLGVNYTIFFQESLSRDARSELAASNLQLDNSFGLSLYAGFDWELNERWSINASMRKIDIDTKASVQSALGEIKVDVDIDPYVYMLSAGYKF